MANYATLLRDHVTLQYRSIDRIFLQAYVPKLQSVGQVCIFLRWQRKFKIPSSAAFGKIGDAYDRARKSHRVALVAAQRPRAGAASALFSVVSPCQRGASPPSVRHRNCRVEQWR